MKKIIFLLITFVVLVSCFAKKGEQQPAFVGMANPWTDCGTDFEQASLVAGFTFPLKLSSCDVRAMDGMIEVNYPLDETRTVCVRKTDSAKIANDTGGEYKGDISGVYIDYPIKKEILLKGCVPIQTRGSRTKIYVMNMAASNGYYSAYCKDGMTIEEIEGIYDIIAEAEMSKIL